MQVKSIAECSKGSILQYFRPPWSYHLSLRSFFCLFLSGLFTPVLQGAQWLCGRVLDLRLRSRRFEPHRLHCVVSLSKNINPSLVLVQPGKTRPYITERLLMGRKESNQTKQINTSFTVYLKTVECKTHQLVRLSITLFCYRLCGWWNLKKSQKICMRNFTVL